MGSIESSLVYCANGTKVLPMGVTEEFLSKQIQLSLADLISILTTCLKQAIAPISESQPRLLEAADYTLNLERFEQIYQQYTSKIL